MNWIYISLVIVAYVGLNFYTRYKINKAFYLSEKRRELHKKLIWFLPFLGALMLRSFWTSKKKKLEAMYKAKRKEKASFYESGKGAYPVN